MATIIRETKPPVLPVSRYCSLQLTPANDRPYGFDNTVTDTVEIVMKKYNRIRITRYKFDGVTDSGLRHFL